MALRGLVVGVALSLLWCGGASGAAGDLDRTFSGDGKLTIDLGGDDSAQDVAIQPNGRIMVVGQGWLPEETTDIAALRLASAGAFDGSFSGDGIARFEADNGQRGEALALQGDGKIVIAGSYSGEGSSTSMVVRFGGDGENDANFGSFGSVLPWNGRGTDVLVQPDGKIVVAGELRVGTNLDFAVGRLLPGGGVDPDFNGGTTVSFGFPNPVGDRAEAVARAADARLLLAGSTSMNIDFAIGSRLATGAPDPLFGTLPLLSLDFTGNDSATDMLVQPDGKLLLAGGGGPGQPIFVAARVLPSFQNDRGFCAQPGECFGRTGVSMGGVSFASAVALQPDGKILLAGTANQNTPQETIAVARLRPDGLLDTSFSGDGKAYVDFPGLEEATGVAVQRDGGIVVVGRARTDSNSESDIVVARLQGDSPGGAGGGPGTGPNAKQRCGGKLATLVGTRGRDKLRGTRRADVIVALGGNDSVKAGGGNDLVCGGAGNDRLLGESGKDRLLGEAGKDNLGGGSGNDKLGGGSGNDRLDGGPGNDSLGGGPGTDRLLGEAGKDKLSGGPGAKDVCSGGSGKDRAACERGRA